MRRRLIRVDERDHEVGTATRRACHLGRGQCHRAILAMLFNAKGDLLLARRSAEKWLWPGWWDGTVAGHVEVGENYVSAATRRVRQELGVRLALRHRWTIRYRARWSEEAGENEICAILVGRVRTVKPDPREISEIRFVPTSTFPRMRRLSPWLRIAWERRPVSLR